MVEISKKKCLFYLQINKLQTFNTMPRLKIMAWYRASFMLSNEIVPSAIP
jgi:hypothetical protein